MALVVQRPAARRDLISHFVYLAENGGDRVAKRFRAAVEETYALMADNPEMGAMKPILGRHSGVRITPVRGFEKYLIVYHLRPTGVVVERVTHSAQDYRRILG